MVRRTLPGVVSDAGSGDGFLADLSDPIRPGSSFGRRVFGSRRVVAVVLAGLVVVAVGLRFRLLDRPMRYDEAFTVWRYAAHGCYTAISDYSLPNNHVMHTLAVAIWGRFFGFAPMMVPVPALVAGVALVPMAYLAASRLAGRAAGLVAAAVLAVSAIMVDASVEARGYTMAALWALVAVWFGSRIRREPGDRLGWLGVVIAGGFGLWTVPVFAYPLSVVAVWLAWPQPGRRRWEMPVRTAMAMVAVGALAVLLYRPILLSDPGSLVANRFVTPVPYPEFLRGLPGLVSRVGASWTWRWWLGAVVVVVGAVVALLPDRRRPEVFRLAVATVVGPAVVLAVHHALPYPRNFLPLYPLAVVVAAAGLTRFPRTNRRTQLSGAAVVAILLVVVGVGSLSLDGTDQPPHRSDLFAGAAEAAGYLAERIGPDDRIAAPVPASAPLRYYLLLEGVSHSPTGNDNIYLVIPDNKTLEDGIEAAGVVLPGQPHQISRLEDGTIFLSSATMPDSMADTTN